jgi:uncharacterized membrane protein
MKDYKSKMSMLAFALTFAVAAAAADAPKLTFTFSQANVPGALQTIPFGVNNAGVTVGQYEDKATLLHGYILDGKKLTKLDDPKGTSTACFSLNPNGAMAVVGYYINSKGNAVGFLYQKDKFTDIPGPAGAKSSDASAINDFGAIVGSYTDSSNITHGFLLKGTAYKTLDVPGAIYTVGTGINNKGSIVLYWEDSKGVLESSIYNGKTYKTFNVPGAIGGSAAQAINSAGDVVYQWGDSSGIHGALLRAGKYYKFDYPKSVFTSGDGINDKNTVVGPYEAKTSGPFSGFKATYK